MPGLKKATTMSPHLSYNSYAGSSQAGSTYAVAYNTTISSNPHELPHGMSVDHNALSRSSVSTRDGERTSVQMVARMILRNSFFEGIMASIILLNFVMIIVEADSTAERTDGTSADAPIWIIVGGWLTLVLFIMELALRIFVQRMKFFEDGWNTFDFIVILLDASCSLLGLIVGSAIPVSALRILRLCKLARISKIFRIFPELRLMMAGLIGSLRSIFWGMVLLFFALLVWAVIGVQFIHPLNLRIAKSGLYSRMECDRCPQAYDSVGRALVTLLKESVAGDSWGLQTVPIIEEHPETILYFMGIMMTVTLAVLNLILGVVVNVAMQSRDDLFQQMEQERLLQRIDAEQNLVQVCADMDTDGSGHLSKEELMTGFKENASFRETLNELGIHEEDLEILWTILDSDTSGQVAYTTFIHKSFSMKESDTQFMLAYIKYYVTRIKDQVLQGQERLKEMVLPDGVQSAPQSSAASDNVEVEEKMKYEEKQPDGSYMQFGNMKNIIDSGGPRQSLTAPVRKRAGGSSRFSEDDMNILEEILEKSRLWREELNVSIKLMHRRLDTLVQNGEWTQLPQPPKRVNIENSPSSQLKGVFCCQGTGSAERTTETTVGFSPTGDVAQTPEFLESRNAAGQPGAGSREYSM